MQELKGALVGQSLDDLDFFLQFISLWVVYQILKLLSFADEDKHMGMSCNNNFFAHRAAEHGLLLQ